MPGVPRSARALWIPFATVIVLLAGLAVMPLVTATQVRRLRREVSEHVAPARVAVNDLEAAIGVELYEGVAGARAATLAERARGAEARSAAAADVAGLRAAVAPLDDAAARAALADLSTAVATWHAGESDARGLAALDAAQRLDDALAGYAARHTARIAAAERTELVADGLLIGFAVLGVLMLARAGARMAGLAALAASQQRALEAAHAERAAVLRGVTHDLRNPLAAARGHLDLVVDGLLGPVTAAQADSLSRSRRLVDATLEGVNDLLAIAMADAGQLAVHPRRVLLADLVRDAAAEHAALAAAAGLALSCRVDAAAAPNAAPLWIETDPARVHQVLGNLLSNACKYTPRGGCVELAGGASTEGGCWLAVRDSGPGVPPDAYDRVFGEAVRLDGTRHIAGAGVGLAAARRVARALGGDLTVGVAPQGGAAFVLALPARAA